MYSTAVNRTVFYYLIALFRNCRWFKAQRNFFILKCCLVCQFNLFLLFLILHLLSAMSKTKQVDYTIRTLPAFRFEEKKGRLKTKICFQTTFYMIPQYETLKQLPHFRFNIVGAHKSFADKEGMYAVAAHKIDIGFASDAAFGNNGFT